MIAEQGPMERDKPSNDGPQEYILTGDKTYWTDFGPDEEEEEAPPPRKKPGPPPTLPNRRHLSIYLDGESHKALTELAERRRLSTSELARRLILRGLPKRSQSDP